MATRGGKREGAGRPSGSGGNKYRQLRERIETEADPIGKLIGIVRGDKILIDGKEYAVTPGQWFEAVYRLADKVAPNVKAVEHDFGQDSKGINFTINLE
jgi:hypothetical protein